LEGERVGVRLVVIKRGVGVRLVVRKERWGEVGR